MKMWRLLAVALCMSACTLRVGNADAVQGKAVQQKIDETIAPLIKSYYPQLKVEPSQCEPTIKLTQGTMGKCALRVNGVPLQIRVISAAPPDMFNVDFGGAFFFDMDSDEKIIEKSLANNYVMPVTGVAHCGKPRERLLLPGTHLTCAIDGTPLVHSVRLKVLLGGQVFVFNVPGLEVARTLPVSLLTLHKQGKAVIVLGADVAAYIQRSWGELHPADMLHAVVTCPARMDLTGMKRGVCKATIPGLKTPERLGFWIEPVVGFRMRPIDAVIDRAKVQRMAQDDINRRLVDNGDAADAVVLCDPGLMVIEPPGTFECKATAAGTRYRLVVAVQDWKGTVSWHGIPLK
jgi:hypothetical protein